MSRAWRALIVVMILVPAVLVSVALVPAAAWGQQNLPGPSVLRIQRSVSTSKTNFPQFVYPYRVLDGVNSIAEARGLTGTISLENSSPNFSEVLWLLVYWRGKCPGVGGSLNNAFVLWSNIMKNPSQSTSNFPVSVNFPVPLPMTGCVGLAFGGGPLVAGKVTMSADLSLTYTPGGTNANAVLYLAGEYCFGQTWGCQNVTPDDTEGFGVPNPVLSSGHLVELFGNISDSTFDGTQDFGPLPTGKRWGAVNDFYLLPGGCGQFGSNLNSQGFPNPEPWSTLYSWLPSDAVHLESVPMEYAIPVGATGEASLQKPVERIFPTPLTANAGDCIVVIYGRTGNGATDNETQVRAVFAP